MLLNSVQIGIGVSNIEWAADKVPKTLFEMNGYLREELDVVVVLGKLLQGIEDDLLLLFDDVDRRTKRTESNELSFKLI